MRARDLVPCQRNPVDLREKDARLHRYPLDRRDLAHLGEGPERRGDDSELFGELSRERRRRFLVLLELATREVVDIRRRPLADEEQAALLDDRRGNDYE